MVILKIQLTLFSEILNHSVTPTVSHLPASFILITPSKFLNSMKKEIGLSEDGEITFKRIGDTLRMLMIHQRQI